MSDRSLVDLLITNAAKDAERHIKRLIFLENEIKTLIGAIRTAPDLECLRAVANDSVGRMSDVDNIPVEQAQTGEILHSIFCEVC